MLMCLRIPVKKLSDKEIKSLRDRVTTLKWELGYIPRVSEIKEVITEEMLRKFGAEAVYAGLTEFEKSLLKTRLPYFQSNEWIYLIKVPKKGFFHSSVKTRGGLIRVAVSVRGNVIQQVYITGDFFVFPQKLIYEIESSTKHVLIDANELLSIIEGLFRKHGAEMPGVSSRDFVKAIIEAANKARLLDLGFTEDEADELIEVLKPAEYVLANAKHLLLPYCSKPVDCKLRCSVNCVNCSSCDFSLVYKVAEKLGLSRLR